MRLYLECFLAFLNIFFICSVDGTTTNETNSVDSNPAVQDDYGRYKPQRDTYRAPTVYREDSREAPPQDYKAPSPSHIVESYKPDYERSRTEPAKFEERADGQYGQYDEYRAEAPHTPYKPGPGAADPYDSDEYGRYEEPEGREWQPVGKDGITESFGGNYMVGDNGVYKEYDPEEMDGYHVDGKEADLSTYGEGASSGSSGNTHQLPVAPAAAVTKIRIKGKLTVRGGQGDNDHYGHSAPYGPAPYIHTDRHKDYDPYVHKDSGYAHKDPYVHKDPYIIKDYSDPFAHKPHSGSYSHKDNSASYSPTHEPDSYNFKDPYIHKDPHPYDHKDKYHSDKDDKYDFDDDDEYHDKDDDDKDDDHDDKYKSRYEKGYHKRPIYNIHVYKPPHPPHPHVGPHFSHGHVPYGPPGGGSGFPARYPPYKAPRYKYREPYHPYHRPKRDHYKEHHDYHVYPKRRYHDDGYHDAHHYRDSHYSHDRKPHRGYRDPYYRPKYQEDKSDPYGYGRHDYRPPGYYSPPKQRHPHRSYHDDHPRPHYHKHDPYARREHKYDPYAKVKPHRYVTHKHRRHDYEDDFRHDLKDPDFRYDHVEEPYYDDTSRYVAETSNNDTQVNTSDAVNGREVEVTLLESYDLKSAVNPEVPNIIDPNYIFERSEMEMAGAPSLLPEVVPSKPRTKPRYNIDYEVVQKANSCNEIREDLCMTRSPGHYPHPTNPNCFIQCDTWGLTNIQRCPPGTRWRDQDTGRPSHVNRCM